MASGNSTIFLPFDPNKLCDRLQLILQEKQTGNNSYVYNEEFFAIVDKELEKRHILKNNINNF